MNAEAAGGNEYENEYENEDEEEMAEPTYPVKEQITAAVAAALAEISIAAGYLTDVASVVRPRRTGEQFRPVAFGVSVLQRDEQREPEQDQCGNPPAIGWRLSIACDLVVRLSEDSTAPMDRVLNTFEADVRKCLMADPTWGNLACETELGATEYADGSEGFEGVTVPVDVIYRVAENDPYVNRV